MLPDLGSDRLLAMSAVIEARRQPLPEMSTWERTKHFFKKRELPQLIGTSLNTLKQQGFLVQDFIEYEVPWSSMKYSTDSLIDFGFRWDDMVRMSFRPDDFKNFEFRHYHQLGLNADRMMQTCMNIHDLVGLGLTPQQLHELHWTWDHMRAIGGTADNIGMSVSDRNMYFARASNSTPGVKKEIRSRAGLKF